MGKEPVSFHTVASIHATKDSNVLLDGVSHDVVRGVPLGSGAAKLFNPGTVPIGRPPDSFWHKPCFVFPVFEPPRLEPEAPRGVPSLGLDTLLNALLEGKL